MIRLYDTRQRQKVPFEPIRPGRAGLYTCGPTVYDSIHIGHIRAAIVPDTIKRWLERRGLVVRSVVNFTDIDDKIIVRALQEQRDWRELTVEYMEEYERLTSLVGNRPPDVRPRATDHIEPMIGLVEQLIAAGHAYVARDGDVYFDVARDPGYGGLSGRKLEDQLEGVSGRISEERLAVKRNPGDFILWKIRANDPGDWLAAGDRVPSWGSPWGAGRPGWHLECSVMSQIYLGVPFDLHAGGMDLIFPHHENEEAQTRCACAAEIGSGQVVKYWVHNGFINVKAASEAELASEYLEGEAVKMSKSLGNVRWVREIVAPAGPFDPLVVRMLVLSAHYRSPITFEPALLDQAATRLDRLYSTLDLLCEAEGVERVHSIKGGASGAVAEAAVAARKAFEEAMDDDFNTALALASVFELVGDATRELIPGGTVLREESAAPARRVVIATLQGMLRDLGFGARRGASAADVGAVAREAALLELLTALRREARADRNWAASDRLRDALGGLGYEVRDHRDGTMTIVRP
jgi:cysteinyl-tRNA synthetase